MVYFTVTFPTEGKKNDNFKRSRTYEVEVRVKKVLWTVLVTHQYYV